MPDDILLAEEIYPKYPALSHMESLGPEAEKQLVAMYRDAERAGRELAETIFQAAVDSLKQSCW